jgi:hypothetical protein
MPKMVLGTSLILLLMVAPPTWGQEAVTGDDICFQTCGGFVGGAEFSFLKPYVGDISGLSIDILTANIYIDSKDNQFDPSWRLWLGYMSPDGAGIRARYWQFDHELAAECWDVAHGADLFSARGRLDMYSVDVEFMQRFDFSTWSVLGTAGLRVAGIDRNFSLRKTSIGGESEFLLANQYDGIGPTMGFEFRRPIGSRGLAVLINSRGTMLFGSRHMTLEIPDAIDELPDLDLSITGEDETFLACGEVQMGFEWSRELSGGTRAFATALWEGQAWGSNSQMAGLMGFTFGAGLAR